mmetsp:Transcript_43690/g.50525  ORF Transcript_43690/g.50525 Transcript_43690/m.50525 type:complete len:642 (+) Transcript_43690:43-1968(+)
MEFASTKNVTFDDIAAMNRERINALGIHPRMRTTESTLLQMMTCIGELTTLAYRGTPLTSFEAEEVTLILGGMAVQLATLGDLYKINVGEAAIQRIQTQLSRQELRKSRCASPPPATEAVDEAHGQRSSTEPHPQNQPTTAPITTEPPQSQVPQLPPQQTTSQPPTIISANVLPPSSAATNMQELPLLLSPVTRKNFFPQLDRAAQFSPEAFDRLGLTFTAPLPDGRVVELIPNGSNIRVTHDQLGTYMAACKPVREAHDVLYDAPPSIRLLPNAVASTTVAVDSGVTESATPVVVKHVDVPAPAGYDAVAVGKLFSPTHFQHGLFSPHSNATGFDIPYQSATGDGSATKTQGASAGSSTPNPSLMSPGLAPMTSHVTSTQQLPSNSPSTSPSTDFGKFLRSLEGGEVSPQQLASMRLRYVVPAADGRVLELVPGGSNVPVTRANVEEYVRMAKERLAATGSVRRTESIKRLEVNSAIAYNPAAEREKFSPTHFAHNMFAPHDVRTQFFVDYDHEEDCLPEALRHSGPTEAPEIPATTTPQQPGAVRSTQEQVPTAGTSPSSQYLEYLTSRGVEGFRGVMEQVERSPQSLRTLGVTWCIPSSLAGRIGDEDPIYDLILNGRSTPVETSHVRIFLDMVRKYL